VKKANNQKNVLLLGSTSFFNDISSETLFTLLPVYLDSPISLGLIGGIISGLGDFIKVFFGYLSDKLGKRKILVQLGYLISSLSKLIIPFIDKVWLFLLMIFDRLGKGIRESPRDSIISLSKKKGKAFGIQKAMDTSGAIIGGLLAYFFISNGFELKSALLVAALIGFLALLPLYFVKVPPFKKTNKKLHKTLKELPSDLKKFSIVSGMFGLVLISPLFLIKTAYVTFGDKGLLIYTLFNIIYVISAAYFGSLSDRVGRDIILKFSFLSAALSFFFMFLGSFGIIVGLVLYGAAFGSFRSSANAFVSEIGGSNKGTALGLFQTILGISIFTGSLLFGYLLKILSNNAYLIGSLFSILTLVIYQFIFNPKIYPRNWKV